jgi:O-antigen ligase
MSQLSPGKILAAILLIGASGAAAVTYIPTTSWERFATTRSEVQEGTMNDRMAIWKAGMRAFSQRPIEGYGTSGFNWAVHSQPHNSYLAVLVENGLIGFVLYGSMFLTVLLKVLGLPKMERRFALVLLATLGIAMLPLGWEDRKPVWLILACLLGLAEARRSWATPAVAQAHRRAFLARPPAGTRPGQPLTARVRNADTAEEA